METALGPVTELHILRAREALDTIKLNLDKGGNEVNIANNLFFSLIPHKFGRKIRAEDIIDSDNKLVEKYDLLDQLATATKLGINNNTDTEEFNQLDTDIIVIEDPKVYNRIVKAIETSRRHRDLDAWKVRSIYEVKIGPERERFEARGKQRGNLMQLFHGTQNGNLLSIILGGLIIPPLSSGDNYTIAGRMFGNGIYGANSSTKSLNYSTGYWSGRQNKFDNVFLLRITFAMGKVYEISGSCAGGPPGGYDSLAAYASKTGLRNDEFIVYSLEQCTITHLIELSK